jgi:hypothetical protein
MRKDSQSEVVPSRQETDFLYGLAEIAPAIGLTVRQAKHRVATGELPIFRVGRIICASRSGLGAWLAARGVAPYMREQA